MDTPSLEAKLLKAQERRNETLEASRLKHEAAERAAFRLADAALLEAERELAAAKGEEHAVPTDFPVLWDGGAPSPILISKANRTFLIFRVRSHRFNPDGTRIAIQLSDSMTGDPMALVEFEHSVSAKLGAPNIDVHEGHPLYRKGLDSSTAQVVRNSRWLRELEDINKVHSQYNKVHSQYNPERWLDQKHFVFWFHDNTFECVAKSYKVEVLNETLTDILSRVYQRMR